MRDRWIGRDVALRVNTDLDSLVCEIRSPHRSRKFEKRSQKKDFLECLTSPRRVLPRDLPRSDTV